MDEYEPYENDLEEMGNREAWEDAQGEAEADFNDDGDPDDYFMADETTDIDPSEDF